jgi:hypothetical protein
MVGNREIGRRWLVATSSITKTFRIKDDEAMERYLKIMETPAKPLPRIEGFSLAKESEKLREALNAGSRRGK